jgi:hypothetical protein
MMTLLRPFLLLASIVLFSGCVSTPVEEEYPSPPLMIAQNADGEVTLAWDSDPGYMYTVFVQVTVGAEWKGLPKAFRIPGTGGRLTVYDQVNPRQTPPRYRLLPEKMDK